MIKTLTTIWELAAIFKIQKINQKKDPENEENKRIDFDWTVLTWRLGFTEATATLSLVAFILVNKFAFTPIGERQIARIVVPPKAHPRSNQVNQI